MSKNFSQIGQKILNPSMKAPNINQKILMDFVHSPRRKKSKIRSPICLNQYKTPPNNNEAQTKYSPSSMVNELTDKKSNLSSQTYKNDQKAITKYSPMIIEKSEQEQSSQKKKKSNNGIMQNLIQNNLEEQYDQCSKVSDNIFGVQQISRIDQKQQFMNYPKNTQAAYQTPTQNYTNKSKHTSKGKSSQKINSEENFYILSDERVSAFLSKNQNNFLYSPFYCSNQTLYDQPIQYSILKLQSDSNKFMNAQSQLQNQNISISNFNKQKVQKFIFNNNQTSNESYQQDPVQMYKNKQFEQKTSLCSDNLQYAGLNLQQINQEGQMKLSDSLKQNKNINNCIENNQTNLLTHHPIKKNFTVKQGTNQFNEDLLKDKFQFNQENTYFKDLTKIERKQSGESIEIENQNVAERLFQKFENVKMQGNEKAEIMQNQNDFIKNRLEKQHQFSRDDYFQRLIDELEEIQRGHISRVHKGKSDQYKEKQKIREKRQMERQRKTYFKQKGQLSLAEENSMHSIQSLENKKSRKNIKVTEKKYTDSTQMEEESQAQEINKQNSNSRKDQINDSIYFLEEDDFEENNLNQFHDQNFGQFAEDQDDEDEQIVEDQSKIITKKICKDKKKKFVVPINKKCSNDGRENKVLYHSKQYQNNL